MFTGFSASDFSRLEHCDSERASVAAFRGNVTAFIQQFNSRAWARAMLPTLTRLGLSPRAFFADRPFSADVDYIHGDEAHWYIYNWGGRWRPQFNIGMFGDENADRAYLRIGIGFNLTVAGHDPDRETGREMVREFYRQFRAVLRADEGVNTALKRWLDDPLGFFEQYGPNGPASLQRRDFVDWLIGSSPEDQNWVFFGRRLRPGIPEELVLLSNPLRLIETIERVFTAITPFWSRACFG